MPIQDRDYDYDSFVVPDSESSEEVVPPPKKRWVIIQSSESEENVLYNPPIEQDEMVNQKGHVIYADCGKISQFSELIGILRFKLNFNVHLCNLCGCHFALSTELSVLVLNVDLDSIKLRRILTKKFVDNLMKDVEKMTILYENVWIILQTVGSSDGRLRSFDRLLANLVLGRTHVLQSDSTYATAQWIGRIYSTHRFKCPPAIKLAQKTENIIKAISALQVINTPALIQILSKFGVKDIIDGNLCVISDLTGVALQRLEKLKAFFCYKTMKEMRSL